MYENGNILLLSIGQKEGDQKVQEKLIILMEKNNVTIRQLANLLEITEKQLSYKLKGKSDFKCSEMFKISEYFDKNLNDIFLPIMYENGTK